MQKSRSKNGMWVHCVGWGRRHYLNEGPCTQGRAKGGLILVIPVVKGITWCINQHFIFYFFPSWYLARIQRVSLSVMVKKRTWGISQNGMLIGASILFSEIPCRLLHSITIPQNTLQVLTEVFPVLRKWWSVFSQIWLLDK